MNPDTPQGDSLLDIRDLVVHYPVRRSLADLLARRPRRAARAVDGVSFTVSRGEMVALVGESGCGKTTTAQAVLRMVDPTAGTVHFGGLDVTRLGHRAMLPVRRRMQMVYQDPYESLDPRFRAQQTLEEPLAVHRLGGDRAGRRAAAIAALERVGLTPPELYLQRYPHEMSGGQRQRLAIAASLVLGPELLVADEPVSMLDVSVRAGVLELLRALRDEADMGILMITHDLSTAAHFADRIAVMYFGRIVESGPAREVVRNPQHPYTRALLSVVPARDPRRRVTPQVLTGEPPNPMAVPDGCRFAPRCPVAVDACRRADPELLPLGPAEATAGHTVACLRAAELTSGGHSGDATASLAARL